MTRSTGPTILTEGFDAAVSAKEAKEREQRETELRERLDRAYVVVLDGWVAAYQSGHVPFRQMIEGVRAGLAVLPDDVWRILPGGVERVMGHVVLRALDGPDPQRKKRGRWPWPQAFKNAAGEIVAAVAAREGLTVSRASRKGDGKTAFERAAEIFTEAGVRGVTANTVEEWCRPPRNK